MTYSPGLQYDSRNYEFLYEAASQLSGVPGITIELGLRRGGGTAAIVEGMNKGACQRPHVAVDPYGDIAYFTGTGDGDVHQYDYTNHMAAESLPQIYEHCVKNGVLFVFFQLEDTEFFSRFCDGVPIYIGKKTLYNDYALVHFDGPHSTNAVLAEIAFFRSRTPVGGHWIFDDPGMYEHDTLVEPQILSLGFELVKSDYKRWYKRISV